jgi:hypothetical protein
MKGSELKTFVEDGLDTGAIGDTIFYQLLNIARTNVEGLRDWFVLKTDYSTSTIGTDSDGFYTIDLPDDFTYAYTFYLVNPSSNTPVYYAPLDFTKRFTYQKNPNLYYVDYANSQIGLTGTISSGYTEAHIVYKKTSDDIESDSSWSFPSRYHAILGFLVAEMNKLGADYDKINELQAIQNSRDAKALFESMELWDDKIKLNAVGYSYGTQGNYDSDGLPVSGEPETPLGLM